jgi:predicted NBD/HSP70 family sugar kinase
VGAPGIVNSRDGIVVNAVNLGWQNLPLGSILQERYRLPVFVLNDCQAAAMGEFMYGSDRPVTRNMIVVRVGHGIGAGVIIDGKVFQGDGGGAGEIGHVMMIREGGLPCRCGKLGCLETMASARAVVQRAEILAANSGPITLEMMEKAFVAGDHLAQQIVKEAGYYLGLAISNLVSTLNIHKIILMGDMTRFGQPWLDAVKKAMTQTTLSHLAQDTDIQIGSLRDNDVILGASALLASNYSLLL